VISIGAWAFQDCIALVSVTIPDTVTRIGNGAFSGCTRLTDIVIPDSVTSIGDLAFAGCIRLASIAIPPSVTQIGVGIIVGCTGLTDVVIESETIRDGGLVFFAGVLWRVLVAYDDEALIISEDILELRNYHPWSEEVIWEFSNMRQYLNGEFINSRFSEAERARILEARLTNHDNPVYGTPGGNDTTDRVFLLSILEAEMCLSGSASRVAYSQSGTATWWWLRTPGAFSPAAIVGVSGEIHAHGSAAGPGNGVRPALWISL